MLKVCYTSNTTMWYGCYHVVVRLVPRFGISRTKYLHIFWY